MLENLEVARPGPGPITRESITAALIDKFISSQEVKENSRYTYKREIRQFFGWLEKHCIKDPTRDQILAYKRDVQTQGKSSLTLSGYLTAVRKFFEWTEGIKFYPNVAKGIKGAKRSKGFRKDPLTVRQVNELLAAVDRCTIQGKRDLALLNLLVRTGLRTIEVIRADVEDMRQEGGEAILRIHGKGRDSKDDFVLLTAGTLRPMQEYLAARGRLEENAPLFSSLSDRNKNQRLTTRSISGLVKAYLRKIGLDNVRLTAHSLRHTAITLSLQGGATIQEAQALGRHADINTTLIYAHNVKRIANAPERKIDAVLAGSVT